MLSNDAFFRGLISSGWRGVVSEAGLGVPFVDGLMRYEEGGASKVLVRGACPYAREVQPKIEARSVSREMAEAQARINLDYMRELLGPGKLFSLAVTGAYKGLHEHGDTHGWAVVIESHGTHMNPNIHAAHFWVPKGSCQTRSQAIDAAGYATLALMGPLSDIGTPDAYFRAASPAVFDVFDRFELAEHADLCAQDNPLVHVPGPGFVRARDWIRRPGLRIFRGSFNPPQRMHELMGRGALWALDFENARKQVVKPADMAHRVWMANLLSAPVLLTRGLPRFRDLHAALLAWGAERPIRYVVGSDTLAAVVDPKYVEGPQYLDPLRGGSAVFECYRREDEKVDCDKVVSTAKAHGLVVEQNPIADVEYFSMKVSSTEARNGNRLMLHPDVAEYVEAKGLYGRKA